MPYTPTVWKTGDVVSSLKLNKIETELSALDTDKANIDGYYESMTVGNAEQLVATVGVEDSVPFNFRTTGGSADVGDRKTMEVVGGTVAWNQHIKSPDFSETKYAVLKGAGSVNSGVLEATADGSGNCYIMINSDVIVANHVYLASADVMLGSNNSGDYPSTYFVIHWAGAGAGGFQAIANATKGTWGRLGTVLKPSVGNGVNLTVYPFGTGNQVSGEKASLKNPNFIDLTQMFGSTIADHIYSLEQANAGAGVAWFRKLFPAPYYAYNTGELMSVKTSAYKSVGFNAFNGVWNEGKYLKADGSLGDTSGAYATTDYIPILPNTTYYGHMVQSSSDSINIAYYDAEKNFIPPLKSSVVTYKNHADTTPSDAYFMRITITKTYTSEEEFCINLHWDGERDGEYEPYESHTYALDSDLELRGIPKLDADNQLYYDGDIYESNGAVKRKYGIVLIDGSNSFNYSYNGIHPVSGAVLCYIAITGKANGEVNFISDKFVVSEGIYGRATSNGVEYSLPSDTPTNSEGCKAWFTAHPTALLYELATPSEETADPFQTPQIVNDFGTEEFVDTRTIPIPVGHNSKYQANLRAKLEMAPNSPSGDGDYIVRQSGGQNTYVPITFPADELPAAPTTDGNYVLKCTVSSGTATFTWEAQT